MMFGRSFRYQLLNNNFFNGNAFVMQGRCFIFCVQPLKKVLAILLLALLLFNLWGYKAWFYYLQQQSQQQLSADIDKNAYDESELITMKVPLSLPYFNSWSDFEQYDGNIEIDGQHYSYVKRKVENDTLVLLCLPNKMQNKLCSDQKNFENLVNGQQNAAANNKANTALLLIKLLMTEYDRNTILYPLTPPVLNVSTYIGTKSTNYCFCIIALPWQPPDFIC